MSKLLGCTTLFVVVTVAVAIASLVFNILIWQKLNDKSNSDVTTTPSPDNDNGKPGSCPAIGDIKNSTAWREAANSLLAAMDASVDPCQDFYQYSCARYIQTTDLNGAARKGTFDNAQYLINVDLAKYLNGTVGTYLTEQAQQAYFKLCVADQNRDQNDPAVIAEKLPNLDKAVKQFLGFPLFNIARTSNNVSDLFAAQGKMERQFTGGPLVTSLVTTDYGNNTKNSLFLAQPSLALARDYYVLPQFIADLQAYRTRIATTLTNYASNLKLTPTTCHNANVATSNVSSCLQAVAEWAVAYERKIAMSSWPETEQRNYEQQYNPYDLDQLNKRLPSIDLAAYTLALTDGVAPNPFNDKIVLQQPTYFAALDAMFASGEMSLDDFTDYLAIHFIMDTTNDYGPDLETPWPNTRNHRTYDLGRVPHGRRKGRGIRRITHRPLNAWRHTKNTDDAASTGCVDDLLNYMPYGPGYTYVKSRTDRETVKKDIIEQTDNILAAFREQINSLDWMTTYSKNRAYEKSDKLQKNYVWPEDLFADFKDTTKVDAYNQDYAPLTSATSYWDSLSALKRAFQTREMFRLLNEPAKRENFLQSPAIVNAWYQPERNSITFPFGILNPPYYSPDFPQAYKYAGQGGTAGHELTHGYDDEGVQFGPEGELVNCTFTHCGIMDNESRKGFVNMAQCVVSQYNSQCCPLKSGNVRCVNGATTQGENIADLGGQMAAYRAYGKYVQKHGKELLVPGLERYTPEQVFWITYGVSWCMKLTDARLQRQLLTDPHAPSVCRVNQVMQDIPYFARDFGCKANTPMFPPAADRCSVWVGDVLL